MIDLLALAALVGAAVPLALVITPGAHALYASAVVTAVLSTAAGVLHVITDVPITGLWLAFILVGYAAVGAVPRLRRRLVSNATAGIARAERIELALVGLVVTVAALLPPAPLAWDARSIWLFHASWLNAPASVFVDAQNLDTIAFSHANYPILGPSLMAVAWGIAGGGENLALGVQTIALVSLLVIALGASVLTRSFARGVSPVVTSFAFFGYVTAGLAIAGGVVTVGYLDPLQAGVIATLVALLLGSLSSRPSVGRITLICAVTLAAVSVKQEGFWFAIVALGVFLLVSVHRQYLAKYLPVAVALGGYATWRIFLSAIGGSETTDASGVAARAPELLDPTSTAWTIIGRVAREFGGRPLVALLVAVALLTTVALVRRRVVVFQRIAMLVLVPVGIAVVVTLTYALGDTRDQIDWWLATSFVRVIASMELLLWLAVLYAVVMLSPWRRPANC